MKCDCTLVLKLSTWEKKKQKQKTKKIYMGAGDEFKNKITEHYHLISFLQPQKWYESRVWRITLWL